MLSRVLTVAAIVLLGLGLVAVAMYSGESPPSPRACPGRRRSRARPLELSLISSSMEEGGFASSRGSPGDRCVPTTFVHAGQIREVALPATGNKIQDAAELKQTRAVVREMVMTSSLEADARTEAPTPAPTEFIGAWGRR